MKKVKIFMVILFCSLSITGCFPSDENKLKSSMNQNSELKLEEVPKKINKTLEKNLIINGGINVPKNIDWKSKEVKLKTWDSSLIENEFLSNKKIKEKKKEDNIANKELKNTIYYMNDNSILALEPGSIRFYEKKGLDIPYDFMVRGEHPFLREDIGEIFKNDTLSGVNKEDAIKLVKNKMDKLGVKTLENPEIYAMDLESLNRNTDYTETPGNRDLHKWEKADEAYVISFKVEENGVPITQIGYITPSKYAKGTRLIAIVGAEGLIRFELSNVYEVEKDIKIDNKLISLDSVLDRIKNKYKNVLLTDPVTIYQMKLEYLPIMLDAKKQLYKLSPMWICKAKQKTTIEDKKGKTIFDSKFYIIIDAVTGREFQIGGIS